MASQAYLVDGMRSPIGSLGGSLLPLRASEFGTPVARALLERTGVKPNDIEHIVAGMVLQDMIESNPARVVGKLIGVPNEVASFTLNMQCCSGMQALILAAQQVALEQYDCVLALGLESMSNAPHLVRGARWGLRMGGTEFLEIGRAHV